MLKTLIVLVALTVATTSAVSREAPVFIQTLSEAGSDPICGSGGCLKNHKKKELGYKINYPVPNFGVDTDIIGTFNALDVAEGITQHKLIMGTEESKAKWHNKAKDTDYNFAPALEGDIISTNKNLADSEKALNHHWALA